jgi:hypothetical protein
VIDIAAIYRDLAESQWWDLFFEIECAYSIEQFDSLRDRIAEFERNPVGAALLVDPAISVSELWEKYHWERAYWGRGRMALAS